MFRTRKDNSLLKVVISVSSLSLVGLSHETIVVQGLPLDEAQILGWIFSVLFNDFKSRGLRNFLMQFFLADAETNVEKKHPTKYYYD